MIARLAVSVRNLVKRYGRRKALDGFSIDIPFGCILGLVGPNGAGKTTFMMSVAGLLRVDSGSISVLESGAFDASVHSGRVAILPQDSELPLESTVEGFLLGLADLQGIPRGNAVVSVREVLAAVNLSDRAKVSIRSLSHGMRKRLMAAQCFLGNPELILLDEPMNGLDPEESVRMRALVSSGKGKRSVVISSHNLSEIERLCTHVAFVENGKVLQMSSISKLTSNGETLESAYLNRNGS